MRFPRCGGPRRGGFTLIELLTVVAIISLLVGMVVPTIQAVMEGMTAANTLARIQGLSAGTTTYKMSATGNRYFPGQQYPDKIEGSGKYRQAASAYLARCLFSDDANGTFPVDNYGGYTEGILDDSTGEETDVPYSILDTHSRTMAIVYYVSQKGAAGSVNQFKPDHNERYTKDNVAEIQDEGGSSRVMDIREFVKGGRDEQGTYIIHRDGEFVLTAADGKTRKYFEGKLKNFD
jgi:prepilin-type N-terminal cleavage/methylation domain-containing protein